MSPLSSQGRWKARGREPANSLPLSIATRMLVAISPWRGDVGREDASSEGDSL